MEKKNSPLVTSPNYFYIAFMFVSGLGFGIAAFGLLSSMTGKPSNVSEHTTQTISLILFILFISIAAGCLFLVLGYRRFTFDETSLVVERPLFFYKHTFDLKDIKDVQRKIVPIMINRGLSDDTLFNTTRATVQLNNGKKLRISSMEIRHFQPFVHELILAAGRAKMHRGNT